MANKNMTDPGKEAGKSADVTARGKSDNGIMNTNLPRDAGLETYSGYMPGMNSHREEEEPQIQEQSGKVKMGSSERDNPRVAQSGQGPDSSRIRIRGQEQQTATDRKEPSKAKHGWGSYQAPRAAGNGGSAGFTGASESGHRQTTRVTGESKTPDTAGKAASKDAGLETYSGYKPAMIGGSGNTTAQPATGSGHIRTDRAGAARTRIAQAGEKEASANVRSGETGQGSVKIAGKTGSQSVHIKGGTATGTAGETPDAVPGGTLKVRLKGTAGNAPAGAALRTVSGTAKVYPQNISRAGAKSRIAGAEAGARINIRRGTVKNIRRIAGKNAEAAAKRVNAVTDLKKITENKPRETAQDLLNRKRTPGAEEPSEKDRKVIRKISGITNTKSLSVSEQAKKGVASKLPGDNIPAEKVGWNGRKKLTQKNIKTGGRLSRLRLRDMSLSRFRINTRLSKMKVFTKGKDPEDKIRNIRFIGKSRKVFVGGHPDQKLPAPTLASPAAGGRTFIPAPAAEDEQEKRSRGLPIFGRGMSPLMAIIMVIVMGVSAWSSGQQIAERRNLLSIAGYTAMDKDDENSKSVTETAQEDVPKRLNAYKDKILYGKVGTLSTYTTGNRTSGKPSFTASQLLAQVDKVCVMARENKYRYGNSMSAVPCDDGYISCDRMITRAIYDLGYTNQPAGGVTIAGMDSFLTELGYTRVQNAADVKAGDIIMMSSVATGQPAHCFIVRTYDPDTDVCVKYDCGNDDRINTVQPFETSLDEWGEYDFYLAYHNPNDGSASYGPNGGMNECFAGNYTTNLLDQYGLTAMTYFLPYESGTDAYDSAGSDNGHAYGAYQFDNRWELGEFIDYCYNKNPSVYGPFAPFVGVGPAGLRPGDGPYQPLCDAWHEVYAAHPAEFTADQDQFAWVDKNASFTKVIEFQRSRGLDLLQCDPAVRGFVYSLHNRCGWELYPEHSLLAKANCTNAMTDEQIIDAVGAEIMSSSFNFGASDNDTYDVRQRYVTGGETVGFLGTPEVEVAKQLIRGDGQYGSGKRILNSSASGSSDSSGMTQMAASAGYSGTALWQGEQYPLSDDQLQKIADMCVSEQGTVSGCAGEASLMLNQYELKHDPGTRSADDFFNYIYNSSWYATSRGRARYSADAEHLAAVASVIRGGGRTLPLYVNEHDCLSDLVSISTGDVNNRADYIPGQTIITNRWSSVYTFYCFPSGGLTGDPFGYTADAYDKAMQMGYQDGMTTAARRLILVGDSRTEDLHITAGDSDGNLWSHKVGSGLPWMRETGVPQIEGDIGSDTAVVILMGVNESGSPPITQQYCEYLNEKAKEWKAKGAEVYYFSVGPVDDAKYADYYHSNWCNNASIKQWNSEMQRQLSSDIHYVDIYDQLLGSLDVTPDGLHYRTSTNELYYKLIKDAVNGSAGRAGTATGGMLGMNTGASTKATQNIKNVKCYSATLDGKSISKHFGSGGIMGYTASYTYEADATTYTKVITKDENGKLTTQTKEEHSTRKITDKLTVASTDFKFKYTDKDGGTCFFDPDEPYLDGSGLDYDQYRYLQAILGCSTVRSGNLECDPDEYLQHVYDMIDTSIEACNGYSVDFETYDTGNTKTWEIPNGTATAPEKALKAKVELEINCNLYEIAKKDIKYKFDAEDRTNVFDYYTMDYENFCMLHSIEVNESLGGLEGVALDVYNYLSEKGMGDVQIAAVIGNMRADSGLDSEYVEGSKWRAADFEKIKWNGHSKGVNKGKEALRGYGLCSWSGKRANDLQAFADKQGTSWKDFQTQMDFFWEEYTSDTKDDPWSKGEDSRTRFEQATETDTAAKIFYEEFEKKKDGTLKIRQRYAKEVKHRIDLQSGSANVESYMKWAEMIANDDSHGYSQPNREGSPDYDCSSLVYYALKQAGYAVPSETWYTGNMCEGLLAMGWTEMPFDKSTAQRGDVVWYRNGGEGHTEFFYGNGMSLGAHGTRGHPEAGDQDGTEISVVECRDVYAKMFRPPGGGSSGPGLSGGACLAISTDVKFQTFNTIGGVKVVIGGTSTVGTGANAFGMDVINGAAWMDTHDHCYAYEEGIWANSSQPGDEGKNDTWIYEHDGDWDNNWFNLKACYWPDGTCKGYVNGRELCTDHGQFVPNQAWIESSVMGDGHRIYAEFKNLSVEYDYNGHLGTQGDWLPDSWFGLRVNQTSSGQVITAESAKCTHGSPTYGVSATMEGICTGAGGSNWDTALQDHGAGICAVLQIMLG